MAACEDVLAEIDPIAVTVIFGRQLGGLCYVAIYNLAH
jgi:hypothetical protein